MIVVVVAQQDGRDGRQILEPHGRLSNAARSEYVQRTCALRVHGVGEEVAARRLNQEGGVADERDRGSGASQFRRLARWHVDTPRPPRSWLGEHSRNCRKWLRAGAGGVEESPAVKVIAPLERHRMSADRITQSGTGHHERPTPILMRFSDLRSGAESTQEHQGDKGQTGVGTRDRALPLVSLIETIGRSAEAPAIRSPHWSGATIPRSTIPEATGRGVVLGAAGPRGADHCRVRVRPRSDSRSSRLSGRKLDRHGKPGANGKDYGCLTRVIRSESSSTTTRTPLVRSIWLFLRRHTVTTSCSRARREHSQSSGTTS